MINRVRATISELGLADGIIYGVGRVIEKWTRRCVIFRYALIAQPVASKPRLPTRRGRDINVRLHASADQTLAETGLAPEVVRYRLNQGAICLAAFQKNIIVGCLWLCLGPYEEDEVRCRFEPTPEGRTSWDFGVYVSPSHRGGIVFARLWDEACNYLRTRGVTWTLSRIGSVNIASMTAHSRLGAKRLGSATFLCLGRWQLMASNWPPYVHISPNKSSRPRLVLRAPRASSEE